MILLKLLEVVSDGHFQYAVDLALVEAIQYLLVILIEVAIINHNLLSLLQEFERGNDLADE